MAMFTIEQINDLHDKLGTMKDFLNYVTALRLLGVEKYDSYLTDGHSRYFGAGGYYVESEPVHEKLLIANHSDKESFLRHLSLHGERKTDYLTMSRGLAESGIEKWTVDTGAATITYSDKQGNQLLVETIV
jgi:uncharacterized protein YbcV (DUF1398 family)